LSDEKVKRYSEIYFIRRRGDTVKKYKKEMLLAEKTKKVYIYIERERR